MRKTLNCILESLIFFFLFISAILLSTSSALSSSAISGIKLWVACILPSVLPYFFISSVLSSLKITGKFSRLFAPLMNRAFNQNGIVAYAFFMSILSGYPMGAKIVSDLKKNNLLSETESVRALALCSTSSPAFLIGAVGNIMFNNAKIGVVLFLCNILSALSVGIVFSFYKKNDRADKTVNYNLSKKIKLDEFISESVYDGVLSSLFVGGLITLFFVFSDILLYLKILNPFIFLLSKITGNAQISKGFILGLIENTKGLKTISTGEFSFFTIPFCAFLSGFGGLSVIMQSLSFSLKAKIKTTPFIVAKLLGAVFGFILGLIFTLLLF